MNYTPLFEEIKPYLSLENMTIGEYEKVSTIIKKKINKESDIINKLIDILEYKKCPDELIDAITQKEVLNFGQYFSEDVINFDETTDEIVVNDRIYKADLPYDEFELKGRYLALALEKVNDDDFYSWCLAIIFKDVELTRTEHFTDAHIKHKKDLFKILPYKLYAPWVIKVINSSILTNVEALKQRKTDI